MHGTPVCNYLIRDYVWHTYKTNDQKYLGLIEKYLTPIEQRNLRWHLTLVAGEKVLMVTDRPESIKMMMVIESSGRQICYLEPIKLALPEAQLEGLSSSAA